MEFHRFGDSEEPPLLFVLGWGNRPDHRPVRWLIDHLVDDGWHVHTATLPVHATDVHREWVRPVEEYAAGLDAAPALAHSAGGLTLALADVDPPTTTYLSPWWGEPPARQDLVTSLAARIPGTLRILPSGIEPGLLGEHATDRQVADAPDWVSPAYLRAARQAHDDLPPIDDEAVVFCSLSDRVVSTRAIGDRVDSDRIRLYDGAHELFSARSRTDHLDTLLAALVDGPAALG